jgi:hypothetical protein
MNNQYNCIITFHNGIISQHILLGGYHFVVVIFVLIVIFCVECINNWLVFRFSVNVIVNCNIFFQIHHTPFQALLEFQMLLITNNTNLT